GIIYGVATFAVLWTLGWLYRDSLKVENIKEKGWTGGGFRVIAGCLTEKGADDLKSATGPYMKTVLLDVTSTASIQKAMEYTKQEVGDNDCGVSTRYSAGWDAKFGWIPLPYMPSCVIDIGLKLVMPRPAKSV
ncbi:unnamed protein product, partial [Coregonus sp. 'balchen']